MKRNFALLCFLLCLQPLFAQIIKKPLPGKLVVLTFDDAIISHYTNAAPLLEKYHFGATFFIAEFNDPSFSDKTKYLSWEQIGKLNHMGFEIANHTRNHIHVNKMDSTRFVSELIYIEDKAKQYGVKKDMISFAYPGYTTHPSAVQVLRKKGYLFARTGGDRVYDPLKDHPYYIPSFSTKADNREQIYAAFQRAEKGKIVVLTIHGVPDEAHAWVNTPFSLFQEYMNYLHENNFKVIALRDLQQYIDAREAMTLLSYKTTNAEP